MGHGGRKGTSGGGALREDKRTAQAESKRDAFGEGVKRGQIMGVIEGAPLVVSPKTKHRPGKREVLNAGKNKISKIITGGQSGVDRGSLDFARRRRVDVGGWYPRGGWAEDMKSAPGLLQFYPEMKETDAREVERRTQWNVRDSDATIIFLADRISSGSNLAADTAKALRLPHKVVSLEQPDSEEIRAWLESLPELETLNLAGSRESENPGSYQKIQEILADIFPE